MIPVRRFILLVLIPLFLSACGRQTGLNTVERLVAQEFPDVSHVPPDSARHMMATSRTPFHVYDVRNPDEYAVSRLAGAELLPPDTRDLTGFDSLAADTPILLYCSVGYRSSAMARRLQERGFTNVHNLRGSIFRWANEDLPLEGDTVVHPYNAAWGRFLRPQRRWLGVDPTRLNP